MQHLISFLKKTRAENEKMIPVYEDWVREAKSGNNQYGIRVYSGYLRDAKKMVVEIDAALPVLVELNSKKKQ